MDRRVFFAVILTAVVIVVTPLLFPGQTRLPIADTSAVSASRVATDSSSGRAANASAMKAEAQQTPRAGSETIPPRPEGAGVSPGDSLSARSAHMTAWYSSAGGSPLQVSLSDYQSRDKAGGRGPVVLRTEESRPLLEYTLRLKDTSVALMSTMFSGSVGAVNGAPEVSFRGMAGGHSVDVSYVNPATDADRYLVRASIQVGGEVGDGSLVITLPPTLASAEADTTDDIRHLTFAYRPKAGDVANTAFAKLDSGVTKSVAGPLEWAGVRNKYFAVLVLMPDSSIRQLNLTGGARVDKLAPRATGQIIVPLHDGRATFELYAGPQEYERLHSLGHQLDQINQYASWMHAVVQPFGTIVTRVLLWMKQTSGLSYGWVIIIFGVLVRLLLWPLNQSAMRTSIRMQRLQPELAEVQKKYKSDPKKQQEALVKLYQSHGMTPFSPMMGCLPMLLPMPILFALYFVFLNTIEFRGVSFLWMHDISAADPYFITPLIMGLSMFVLSWIGMRGTPPTPQTRMMSYMMPFVLTFMFLRFAAGLNLYYAVQNLAALPQQWLLSKERAGLAMAQNGGDRRSTS